MRAPAVTSPKKAPVLKPSSVPPPKAKEESKVLAGDSPPRKNGTNSVGKLRTPILDSYFRAELRVEAEYLSQENSGEAKLDGNPTLVQDGAATPM